MEIGIFFPIRLLGGKLMLKLDNIVKSGLRLRRPLYLRPAVSQVRSRGRDFLRGQVKGIGEPVCPFCGLNL